MENQDSTKCFLYDILRVETIRELEAYIKDGKCTLAELKDCFGTFLSKLPEKELEEIDNVKKFVEALDKQGVIGANDVKLLKVLTKKIGLDKLKEKVEEYEADCSDDVTRSLATMENQDSTKCFLYDNLRVETIRQLDAYIADGEGTLAQLKDRFGTFLSKLPEKELEEIDNVKKFVEALDKQGVIGANDVKLLKVLTKKIGLDKLKEKVEEYEADCSDDVTRSLATMENQDSTKCFLYDNLRVETIRQLDAYIADGEGTLAQLKDRFGTFLSKLPEKELEEIDNVKKFVEALEEQDVIRANDVKFLKALAKNIELDKLKEKVKEYEADCAGNVRRSSVKNHNI
ncbi:uncharacterized protein LOC116307459 [Actinia tenebrosa]|uniref:Uncharacterized protein LOC116307459 n=1 Tax=Actinia tenebrosa TaxID=6105 RepID=A0A6P8J9R7_ACTTE|nr:uncharacterized protein LOC116307459 [Actinia tenebrosa]